MKAEILGDTDSQVLLTITPETDIDRKLLERMAKLTNRTCIINHRGFNYMGRPT